MHTNHIKNIVPFLQRMYDVTDDAADVGMLVLCNIYLWEIRILRYKHKGERV